MFFARGRIARHAAPRNASALDTYRRTSSNLHSRVRALFFSTPCTDFTFPIACPKVRTASCRLTDIIICFRADSRKRSTFSSTHQRSTWVRAMRSPAPLATAYKELGLRNPRQSGPPESVRSVRGNQWMFPRRPRRRSTAFDLPRIARSRRHTALYPVLTEKTPVRMDLTHSAWSDIFFLGMDFPEGARVLNVSIDLAVRGRDRAPKPPVESYLRVIDQPVLRLGQRRSEHTRPTSVMPCPKSSTSPRIISVCSRPR